MLLKVREMTIDWLEITKIGDSFLAFFTIFGNFWPILAQYFDCTVPK